MYKDIKSIGNSRSGGFLNYGLNNNPYQGRISEIHHDEEPGEVIDIILNDSHPDYKTIEDIGKVKLNMFFSHSIEWARPINNNMLYPLLHEIVMTKYIIGYEYADSNIPARHSNTILYYESPISTLKNINNNSMNNVSFDSNINKDNSLGETFKNNFDTFLSPFLKEGEYVNRGRQGQSIIFSYNDKYGDNPLTLIYNKYNEEEPKELDLNSLKGIIALWSDPKNNIPLKELKQHIKSKGESLLLNDDNVILNSNNNMYLSSNNYMSIFADNKLDIESRNILINSDHIQIGGKTNQPAVLGKNLNKLLRKLIYKISSMKVNVAGVTGPIDPTSSSEILELLNELEDISSNNVYIK